MLQHVLVFQKTIFKEHPVLQKTNSIVVTPVMFKSVNIMLKINVLKTVIIYKVVQI